MTLCCISILLINILPFFVTSGSLQICAYANILMLEFFTTLYQYGHWPQKSSIFQAHIFITALCFIVSCGDAYAALNISVDTPFTSWIIAL